MKRYVYTVEVGITYYVVAKSMKEANDIMWRDFEKNNMLKDVDNHYHLEQASEDEAKEIRIYDVESKFIDGRGMTYDNAYDIAQNSTESGIIGCSEW